VEFINPKHAYEPMTYISIIIIVNPLYTYIVHDSAIIYK